MAENLGKPEQVFHCRQCGKCCYGRGGIVLMPKDIQRLAAFLHITCAELLGRHTEEIAGKPRLKTGADHFCLFYAAQSGCLVHPARPDVCRAWPFFRGNLLDRHSFALAREDCPGINAASDFEDFRACGITYMEDENLFTSDANGPNALKRPG